MADQDGSEDTVPLSSSDPSFPLGYHVSRSYGVAIILAANCRCFEVLCSPKHLYDQKVTDIPVVAITLPEPDRFVKNYFRRDFCAYTRVCARTRAYVREDGFWGKSKSHAVARHARRLFEFLFDFLSVFTFLFDFLNVILRNGKLNLVFSIY